MQSPYDTTGGYPNQRRQQTSSPSTGAPSYVGHSGQTLGYRPVIQSAQAQRSTYGHPQDPQHLLAGDPSGLPSITSQQPGQFVNPQYAQYNASGTHGGMGASLNPGIPAHFQNYRPIEHGQPIVPSQYGVPFSTPRNTYPNPAMQTWGGHAQYLDPATGVGPAPATPGSSSPPPSTSSNPLACDICGAPFTLPQNLKRHYESQHTMVAHVCDYCQKPFTRVDSLKRHMDRPCSKMPQSPPEGAA